MAELLRGETEFLSKTSVAVKAYADGVGDGGEEEVEELFGWIEVGEEAGSDESSGNPAEGPLDRSDTVVPKKLFKMIHGLEGDEGA